MPLHDYECPNGHRFEQYEQSWRTMQGKAYACPECGVTTKTIVYQGRWNHIHPEDSALGYGQFQPAFGEVVRNRSHKNQLLKEMGGKLPAGRIAEPEEIAHVVAFLASEPCSYMFGSSIYLDGGERRGTP